jgi:hypothetical protein
MQFVTYPPTAQLKILAWSLAELANANNRQECCDRIVNAVLDIRQRDRRSTATRPGEGLERAAKAAAQLDRELSSINEADREWVEHIKQSEALPFPDGQIGNPAATATNMSVLLHNALGKTSPLPKYLRVGAPGRKLPPQVRDQMLRELVFDLLIAAEMTGGQFTLNKNSADGTLAVALDRLRPYLPSGLVPDPVPVDTVQRLKADFFRNRL